MSSSDAECPPELGEEMDKLDILSRFVAVNSSERQQKLRAQQALESRLVCISVPDVENEDEFEYLPGHSHIKKIVSKTGDENYTVELHSGDIIKISHSELLDLKGGPTALALHKKAGPRRPRQPQKQGFVNSTTLVLSSDEDDPLQSKQQNYYSSALSTSQAPSSSSSSESEENESSSSRPVRRSRRIVPRFRQSLNFEDDDSDAPRRRSRRIITTKSKPQRQGVRVSDRIKAGGHTRTFLERAEDDISEAEVTKPGTKYSGAREVFQTFPKDDAFRLRHQAICATCSYGESAGSLVHCQGCTSSYHKACLGPRGQRLHLATKVNNGFFILQCRACVGMAHTKDSLVPHLGKCSKCNELGSFSQPVRAQLTARQEQLQREENDGVDPSVNIDPSKLNNPGNVMFRCATCKRSWHMSHLPPKKVPRTVIESDDDNDKEPGEDKDQFQGYSRRWQCYECENAPGEIEALVAWRPVDLDSFTPGYTAEMLPEISKEYLVKWRKLSYFKATWVPGAWIWGVAPGAMRKAFLRSSKNFKPCMTSEDAIAEEFLHIDVILNVQYSNVVSNRTREIDLARIKEVDKVYAKYKGLPYEEAVWEAPPAPENTDLWRSFQSAYSEWIQGNYVRPPNRSSLRKRLNTLRQKDFNQVVKKEQPSSLVGGRLMQYQIQGLNWIYESWFNLKNAILADEMGLGKTIQVIAFFATLVQDHNCWPFLVVVPNSTVPNWRNEIRTWAPNLRVVTYYGLAAARKLVHDHEMFPGTTDKADIRCHVLVTSYEAAADPHTRRILSGVQWQGLVVDEGHRLKNDQSQLYESLSRIHFPFKLLLTGTPLQNNIRELFNLIQFCDSTKNAQALEAEYENLTAENISELHKMILPFFLRRTKAQVLGFLPPMAQIIVPVSMTIVQKKLYKSILAKNPQLIKAIFKRDRSLKQSERHNLNNILVQLRKCLCHPFVYSKAIEERGVNATLLYRNLVEASAKLQLLELLLPKLQERGHRVLIFSQFLDFLDIIEDFLDGLGLLHLRLDGSLSSLQKQKRIDEYNAPNSQYFAFLLSTRAGGVGINLATADTVIIMDPDFNPHQDIQALSRAHRIGQQKKVLVFQLMMKGTAEEKMIQIGRKKMALDQALIGFMDAEDESGVDVESILRHGADALFDDDDQGDVHYDNDSIEKLLDRSVAENTKVGEDSSAESQFSFARIWTNQTANLEDQLETITESENSTVWEKILKERELMAKKEALEKAETLGRGKRRRQAVDYVLPDSPSRKDKDAESDAEFTAMEAEPDSDIEGSQTDMSTPGRGGKRTHNSALGRPYKRAKIPEPEPFQEPVYGLESLPCMACNKLHLQGDCRLKQAGVEHCGLCGIAHYGHSRTCPHLNSEIQLASMLNSLRQSTEQVALVEEATKYLRGIRGDLVRRKKVQAMKAQPDGLPEDERNNPVIRAPPIGPVPPSYHPHHLPQAYAPYASAQPPVQYTAPPQIPAQYAPSPFASAPGQPGRNYQAAYPAPRKGSDW